MREAITTQTAGEAGEGVDGAALAGQSLHCVARVRQSTSLRVCARSIARSPEETDPEDEGDASIALLGCAVRSFRGGRCERTIDD